MVVELISVGTEILMGNIVNTNAAYLSEKCVELGLFVYQEVTIGDNEERLKEAILTALSRSDIVILTGGLGPTKDDLTKETVAKIVEKELVIDNSIKQKIKDYFENNKTYPIISENNWKQANVIKGAKILENNNGTAPGLIVKTKEKKRIILLPGPPGEMVPMFEEKVFPYLKELQPTIFYSKMVKVCGIGESMAETMLSDLIEKQTNPTIAPYAKTGEVHFRVTASANSIKEAKELVKPVVTKMIRQLKGNVYTTEEKETLEENVVNLLKKYNLTLATAESCTGGLFAARLVNVSGVSDSLKAGYITYSNKAKRRELNVKKSTLDKFGAVSEETAKEMAKGAAKQAKTDIAISITGIAGPDGGTKEKPVGLIYIGCYIKGKVKVKELHLKGNRQKIRENTVVCALDLLRRCIISNYI